MRRPADCRAFFEGLGLRRLSLAPADPWGGGDGVVSGIGAKQEALPHHPGPPAGDLVRGLAPPSVFRTTNELSRLLLRRHLLPLLAPTPLLPSMVPEVRSGGSTVGRLVRSQTQRESKTSGPHCPQRPLGEAAERFNPQALRDRPEGTPGRLDPYCLIASKVGRRYDGLLNPQALKDQPANVPAASTLKVGGWGSD